MKDTLITGDNIEEEVAEAMDEIEGKVKELVDGQKEIQEGVTKLLTQIEMLTQERAIMLNILKCVVNTKEWDRESVAKMAASFLKGMGYIK
jgi:hypothetical protein